MDTYTYILDLCAFMHEYVAQKVHLTHNMLGYKYKTSVYMWV